MLNINNTAMNSYKILIVITYTAMASEKISSKSNVNLQKKELTWEEIC